MDEKKTKGGKRMGGMGKIVFVMMVAAVLTACGVLPEEGSAAEPTQTETVTVAPIEISEMSGAEPKDDEPKGIEPEQEPVVYVGDDMPVTRGLAAKMLVLAFSDANSIDLLEREITFTDCESGKWYDRYVNAAVLNGIMSGAGEVFMPEEALTLYQAQLLLDKLDKDNEIKMQVTEENGGKPISYALWTELYMKLLVHLGGEDGMEAFGISEVSIVPLATPETNDRLSGYNMITDTGALTYSGLVMEQYVDKLVRVLKKDSEIVAVLYVESETPLIRNVFIVEQDDSSITIFSGGAERAYLFAEGVTAGEGRIADIRVKDGTALSVEAFGETVTGTVKRNGYGFFELEQGVLPADDGLKVYSTADGAVKWRSLTNIIVGTAITDFIVSDGIVRAAIITGSAKPGVLRVALHTTGFGGLVHEKVEVSASAAFNVRIGEKLIEFAAGEVFAADGGMFEEASRLYVTCDDGKIILKSVKRNWEGGENPAYRGVIEIAREDGGYSIINEVSIEQYLYAVVPSEMPSSHGLEAAKVQAVTARSYAYTQFFANRYHRYGGNVDDSVSCQVYNNIPENQTSITAVNETKGQCLTYNGSVIAANFFSTSSGMTANSGEVWANSSTRQFPTTSSAYLKAEKQWNTGADYGDLSLEENAQAFFKSETVQSFDSAFSWFRWNVTMTAPQIADAINYALKTRYQANPRLIKTLQESGAYLSRPIETIGDLVDIAVEGRGEGGNILQLKITGTQATILVMTEYNIRYLLSPVARKEGAQPVVLKRLGGTELKNYSLMPSAFFVMDKSLDGDGKLLSITFFGGGNGHGVGMSQNGVKGMIDAGFSMEQIFLHYYKGTEVREMIFY